METPFRMCVVLTLCAVGFFVSTSQVHANSELQKDALRRCSDDFNITLNGRIEDGVLGIFETGKLIGDVQGGGQTGVREYLQLFPPNDRLAARDMLNECLLKVLESSRKSEYEKLYDLAHEYDQAIQSRMRTLGILGGSNECFSLQRNIDQVGSPTGSLVSLLARFDGRVDYEDQSHVAAVRARIRQNGEARQRIFDQLVRRSGALGCTQARF